jgi:hypothetical protein
MSYYILPKTNTELCISPQYTPIQSDIILSRSLFYYYNQLKSRFNEFTIEHTFDEVVQNSNQYEFLYTKIPGTNSCVSKLSIKSNTFYDLIEIIHTLNVFDNFKIPIQNALHITQNYMDTIECIDNVYDKNAGTVSNYYNAIDCEMYNNSQTKYDFIFFEPCSSHNYIIDLIKCLYIIVNKQSTNGGCIIKIDTVFHKPVVDILYLLSSMYETVHIIKPTCSNIATFEKYVVCHDYIPCDNSKIVAALYSVRTTEHISSLLKSNIPLYFINKLDDINIIIGQQQLDYLDLIVPIYNLKNKSERLETIQKTNIQKSIHWCEKYKIPCNKANDKPNMFLPLSETI